MFLNWPKDKQKQKTKTKNETEYKYDKLNGSWVLRHLVKVSFRTAACGNTTEIKMSSRPPQSPTPTVHSNSKSNRAGRINDRELITLACPNKTPASANRAKAFSKFQIALFQDCSLTLQSLFLFHLYNSRDSTRKFTTWYVHSLVVCHIKESFHRPHLGVLNKSCSLTSSLKTKIT